MGFEIAISYKEILLRVLLATLIGLIFGIERERSHKPAGVRTHVLVCLAACVIAIISIYGFVYAFPNGPANVNVNADPARLVTGVLTGIGFLGAGIIWKSPTGSVQGITTAAEIFMLAALGIACGLGMYFLVGLVSVIAFITMLADSLYRKSKRDRFRKQSAENVNPESAVPSDEEYESHLH
ncbi:MAG: MgtC/SapB family protein [Oscillospiraceae bacterium]|nr:MgtC/SapB family protein [Oscillospiraceae bacterium]